ncbi:Pentatricopeptide repeat-containing protein [Nymphaea thermarum]|nr:Pentatricopeptide repeat-containing protein [Nymphaea thermarum]
MTRPSLSHSLISLLRKAGEARNLSSGKQVHANVIVSGLHSDALDVALTAMYALCGDMIVAETLFEKMGTKNSYSWNCMIKGYATNGHPRKAFLWYERMNCEGIPADNFTYPFLFKACSCLSAIKEGRKFHLDARNNGYELNPFVANSILDMYMKCGCLSDARQLFDTMPVRTVVSWNTMISGYFQNGHSEEALMMYDLMKDTAVDCDAVTFVGVLPACSQLKNLQKGKEIHELVDSLGLANVLSVKNCLIDMYAKCGCLKDARHIFDAMAKRDVVSWTALIDGYVQKGEIDNALSLFCEMQISNVRPNSLTLSCLLSGCTSASFSNYGKCIHGFSIRNGLHSDVFVETALIDMYLKSGNLDVGHRLFKNTSRRRTVPWNAIIGGYAQNGLATEAVALFKQMLLEKVEPDRATVVSVLPSYASIADLKQGENMHCHLIKTGFSSAMEISTGLIDVYMKCGSLDSARMLFDGMSKRDVVAWSAIISGYGMHGDGHAAVCLFNQMIESGLDPNKITFTSIIQACSHRGLLEEGLDIFRFMMKNYDRELTADHYACVVDLLARAGRLEEAHELIRGMPFSPNYAVWGALLGGCSLYGDVELGELAAIHLFQMEPENTGNYVLLSNVYAAAGRWEDAERLRGLMRERGLRKSPGCSMIELKRNIACQVANEY